MKQTFYLYLFLFIGRGERGLWIGRKTGSELCLCMKKHINTCLYLVWAVVMPCNKVRLILSNFHFLTYFFACECTYVRMLVSVWIKFTERLHHPDCLLWVRADWHLYQGRGGICQQSIHGCLVHATVVQPTFGPFFLGRLYRQLHRTKSGPLLALPISSGLCNPCFWHQSGPWLTNEKNHITIPSII